MKNIVLLLLYFMFTACFSVIADEAILQAKIEPIPSHPHMKSDPNQIQPGTPIKFRTKFKNIGDERSSRGYTFIRFAFPKPFENRPNSVIFETEMIALPPLSPKEETFIEFSTPHQWPTIYDFVRFDWGMRQYQVIVLFDEIEEIIGTLSIAFSAYYYPGHMEPIAAEVPTK